MKRLIICTALLGLAFSNAAQAKGCIKGAIVGGVAGWRAMEKSVPPLAVPSGIMKPTNPTLRRLVRNLPLRRSESVG